MIRSTPLRLIALLMLALMWNQIQAAENGFIRYCQIKDLEETNSITPFNQDKNQATPMDALLVVVSEGERALAQVRCDTNGPLTKFFGPIPENSRYQIEMSIAGGEKIPFRSSKGQGRWVVPVANGKNQIRVTFQDTANPGLPEHGITLDFQARVYTVKPSGQLKSPFSDDKQNISNVLTDPKGNIYTLFSANKLKAAARFSPTGGKATLYDIGSPDPKHGHQVSLQLLFVDDRGHLFAEVHGNLIEYDKTGSYVQTLGTFNTRRIISSAADLAHDAEREVNRENPPAWKRISRVLAVHHTPVVTRNAVYFLATVQNNGSHLALVRYQPGSEPEVIAPVAGNGTPYSHAEGMVLSPQGQIHIKVKNGNEVREILAVDPVSGKTSKAGSIPTSKSATPIQKRIASVGGKNLLGMDSGGYYTNECFYLTRNFGMVTARPLNNQGLRYRYIFDSRSQWMDRLTAETVGARGKASQKRCWVHKGEVYVLYNDMRIAQFTPQDGSHASAPKAVQSSAVKADTLEIVGVGAEIAHGMVLNGSTLLELEVRLTDGDGKPRSGTTIESRVWQNLPRKIQLTSPADSVTNEEGRLRLSLQPPRITRSEMESGKWAPEARVTVSAGETEAQVRIPLYGLMTLTLSVERPGFATLQTLPVELADARGGLLQGQVAYRLGAALNAGQINDETDVPIPGAMVRLNNGNGEHLSEAVTDDNGLFQLQVGNNTDTAETLLQEPVILTGFDQETSYFLNRTRATLQQMSNSNYGYDVSRLRAALLPVLVTDLAGRAPSDASRVRSRLVRLGLLVTAIREAHDLARHSGERFAESMVSVMSGLGELFDPLGDDKLGALIPSGGGEAVVNKLLNGSKGFKNSMAQWLLGELEKNFTALATGAGLAGKEVAWYWVKKILMQSVADTAGVPWKQQLVDGLMEVYRKESAVALTHATRAWTEGTISDTPSTEESIRARYAQLAEAIQQASKRQLDLDLYKADIDFGFDVVGQGLVVLAAVQSGPTAAEQVSKGVDLIGKGLKTLTTGADAYVGFQWLLDYEQARQATADFTRATLDP